MSTPNVDEPNGGSEPWRVSAPGDSPAVPPYQPLDPSYPGAKPPYVYDPPDRDEPVRAGVEWGVAVGVAAVIAALGLGLGLIWSGVAPWVPAVRVSDGAVLSQPEQEQMIAAEGWYLIITILAGVAVAVLAWALLRRVRGVPALLGVTVGSVAAGPLAYWVGHHLGRAHAEYLANHAPIGTAFSVPPNLRAQQLGLWHGWLPYARGDVLAMAIAAVVTYFLLAGFSSDPNAAPDPTAAIRGFFRPELIGRLDAVVPFRPLPPHALERIVELELAKLHERPGLVARNLRLELSPSARTRLAALGHDPELGARPLRRTIEDLIVAPLAERMVRDPDWRDATVRIGTANEPADLQI